MKCISCEKIEKTIHQLFLLACIGPGEDMQSQLTHARQTEVIPHAKEILTQLYDNNCLAQAENIPACQDTGLAVVFADIGQDVVIQGGYFEEAVQRGVKTAYQDGHFRKSVLHPLTRINTGDNTPAIIHSRMIRGDNLHLTAVPKGFGSENMSQLVMLKPSDGEEGILDFLEQSAQQAGGSPCPPVVLGVGVGGTFESSALLAKRQLLRKLGQPHPDPAVARLESIAKERINGLGMGPMGMGGENYCLAVHMQTQHTHIAGLPVAVNFCCHMLRHQTAVL